MKKGEFNLKSKKTNLIVMLTVVFIFVISNNCFAKIKEKVLILPFNIDSETDLSFLQKGITRMLLSRLSNIEKVTVVQLDKKDKTITNDIVVSIGKKYSADYVLYGNITVFGNSISTDAICYDVKNDKKSVIFNKAGNNRGDVIAYVNLFAQQVGETVFGYTSSDYKSRRQMRGQQYPNNLRNMYGTVTTNAWKSGRFKGAITALAVGDVDGNKENETIFASKDMVTISRKVSGKLQKIAEVKVPEDCRLLNIDTADINKNGKDEIFVTCIQLQNRLNEEHSISRAEKIVLKSFVMEWDGKVFVKIKENSEWLFRVIDGPEGHQILIGQKPGFGDKLFKTPVYELQWKNDDYLSYIKLALPQWIGIYGFTYGDVCNDGKQMIVALKKDGHIEILDKNGSEHWSGTMEYGGNMIFIEVPGYRYNRDDGYQMDRHYLKQKIMVADVDRDGKNEVIVVKNRDKTDGLLEQYKLFDRGEIYFLKWNTLGLQSMGHTQKMAGYISDFTVTDYNGNGDKDVVYAVTSAKGFLGLGKDKSYIVSQTLK